LDQDIEGERLALLEREVADLRVGGRLEVAGLEDRVPALADRVLEHVLLDLTAKTAADDRFGGVPLPESGKPALAGVILDGPALGRGQLLDGDGHAQGAGGNILGGGFDGDLGHSPESYPPPGPGVKRDPGLSFRRPRPITGG